MLEKKKLENKALMAEIVSLCQHHESGTIFIATADNRLAKMALIEGEIVCASIQRLKGMDAIQELKALNSGVFGFNPGLQLVTEKHDLPATDIVLEMLQSSAAIPVQSPPGAGAGSDELTLAYATIKEVLVNESTEYLGPMAAVICQDYLQPLEKSLTSSMLLQVIRQIEMDINNTDKSKKFRHAVTSKLGL